MNYRFRVKGDMAGYYLACGNAYCFHADFMNGWKKEEMERLTNECLRSGKNCVRP